MNEYRTIKTEAKAEQVMQKSRFIARIAPVSTEGEALDYVSGIRKAFRDATHHCYAFSLVHQNIGRYHDDGEPASTAGLPIFQCLKARKLFDCVLVVTRYFGGTLLGTGGLVRAYGGSAALAADAAAIVVMKESAVLSIRLPYPYLDAVQNYLSRTPSVQVQSADYTDTVCLRVAVRIGEQDQFTGKIHEITQRKASVCQINQGYLPWES